MTYRSEYGKIEGLRDRLDQWRERLGTYDYPWMGTGLIDDLKAAVCYMDGERTDPPEDLGVEEPGWTVTVAPGEVHPAPIPEFDL